MIVGHDVMIVVQNTMDVGHANVLQALLDVASGGSCKQDCELIAVALMETVNYFQERIWPLDQLGFIAIAPALPIFLKGANANRIRGDTKLLPHLFAHHSAGRWLE